MGAKIKDASGKIYGGGFMDPERQFKLIEKQALSAVKSKHFNVKQIENYIRALCPTGKASGGRIG